MSDTTLMECKICGQTTNCINGICQECYENNTCSDCDKPNEECTCGH